MASQPTNDPRWLKRVSVVLPTYKYVNLYHFVYISASVLAIPGTNGQGCESDSSPQPGNFQRNALEVSGMALWFLVYSLGGAA